MYYYKGDNMKAVVKKEEFVELIYMHLEVNKEAQNLLLY